jgi:hypothetical protein
MRLGGDLGVDRAAMDAVVDPPVFVVQLQVQARGPLLHRLTLANVRSEGQVPSAAHLGVRGRLRELNEERAGPNRGRSGPAPLSIRSHPPHVRRSLWERAAHGEYPTGGAIRSPALLLQVAVRSDEW